MSHPFPAAIAARDADALIETLAPDVAGWQDLISPVGAEWLIEPRFEGDSGWFGKTSTCRIV